ncbi:arylsulfatase D [Pimephales promelas]|uniref:arylsulfatase D n=1 Tax=Pimephales promelas TaxID=90988 RepID=UPI001955894D|nr:arylsulfatase D [Pimephales promelas]XP_039543789.1 arylsulfatase D [Pimephales promelas]KAG1956199.1 steryl-sulfatase [Pimephales promelas]
MDITSFRVVAGLLVLFQSSLCVTNADPDFRPNFVLMMVDDLGIGDLGCYGNDTIRTPNIDGLASAGVTLTHHVSAAPLCTPSRTAFMTGRYAPRAGLGSTGRVQVILFLAGSGGLPPNETTFAKLLQKQGYTTGIVGKWHLGVNCASRNDHCHHPNTHGFDFFYGLPFTFFNDCRPGEGKDVLVDLQEMLWRISTLVALALLTLLLVRAVGLMQIRLTLVLFLAALSLLSFSVWFVPFELLRTWNCIIMRNGKVVEQPLNPETLNARLMSEAEQFVERHRDGPFLLFLSFAHVHTPLFVSERFAGKSKHGLYGDNVEEVDWMVGRMMETIEKHGLSEKTLTYFTSDHGGQIEDPQRGGWNGIYRGGKAMGGWEGGIRVPGIFHWPGRLTAGRQVTEPTSLMDVFPTVVKLAGGVLPENRILDGHDLMPLLEGKTNRSQHEFMFHYCGIYLNAVRWHPHDSDSIFKVHFFTPNFSPAGAVGCYDTGVCGCHRESVTYHDPPLVFELLRDPSESLPLTPETEPRFSEVLERVRQAVEDHRRTHTPVENQLTWKHTLWRPWLQPCCGTFPFCSCSENSSHLYL